MNPVGSFVRSTKTGDLGELKEIDGARFVILSGRQGQAPIPYDPANWVDESAPRPMSLLQAAQIAWAADQKLMFFLGEHARSRKEWFSLREEDRAKFANEGPGAPPVRRLLWRCIMMATEPLRKVA